MTAATRLAITFCILLSAFALSNAQKKDPDPFDRVMKELQAGRVEHALAALDDAIKQNPNNADAYLFRGSLRMQSDPAQALNDFNKAIELRPDSGAAYNQRAMMRAMNNDLAGALKDLDAAIAHNYKDDSVYYFRSQLRWQTGELKSALSDLDETIKLNPGHARAYSTRSDLLLVLNEPDRALGDINYLLSWYETDPSARPVPKASDGTDAPKNDSKAFMVRIAQETANEAPGAKEMVPVISRAYANRGLILSGRNNHVGALADLDKATRIDPTNEWALYHRANEYEYKGDLPAALADISKAIQIDPKNANLLIEHGVILLLMGKDKEAQADFDVFLRSDRALWQKRIDARIEAVKRVIPNK